MSPIAIKSALWGAQNRLRGVRDNTEVLSPYGLDQAGVDPDELADPIAVLGARPIEDDVVYGTSFNLSGIYKDSDGVWHFVLVPFVIPPLLLPSVPADNWIGGLADGRSQTAPIDPVTGEGNTLWLNVVGSIERVETSPGYWENKSGEFSISEASLSWQNASWTAPAPPAIPGTGVSTEPFDWWVELMTPNTGVAGDHPDYNKPVGNSAFEVNHGDREFYPPHMYS